MAKLLKLRRGTTSQHSSFTGAEGEVTVDTDKETLVVHNGSTAGGFPLLRASGGSENISTSGTFTSGGITSSGNLTLSSVSPNLIFTDTNHDSDFKINVNAGVFTIHDVTNDTSRLQIASDGTIDIAGNLDANGGLDVTGNITATGDASISGGDLTVTGGEGASAVLNLIADQGDDNGDGWKIQSEQDENDLTFKSNTSGSYVDKLKLKSSGQLEVQGNLVATGDISTTGDVLCSDITLTDQHPVITFTDSDNNPDFIIKGNSGNIEIEDVTNNRPSLTVYGADNHIDIHGNLDVGAGIDCTGNMAATGNVTGVNGTFSGNVAGVEGTFSGVVNLTRSSDEHMILSGSSSPYIRFQEGTTNKAYVRWHNGGYLHLVNQEDDAELRIRDILTFSPNAGAANYEVWHEGNDGSGSSLDADLLDGQHGSHYLNYNNLSNTPTIPTNTNQLTNGAGFITSASFSDVAGGGTFTGDVTFNGNAAAVTIGGGGDIRLNSGGWTGDYACKIQNHDNVLYIQGGSNASKSIIFRDNGGGDRWYITQNGHLIPQDNNSYDIGSSSNRVQHFYTNDLHLSNEGHSNDMDGTWGDWTIQEGESDLFLKNNRSGKKFKFNLTEVS